MFYLLLFSALVLERPTLSYAQGMVESNLKVNAVGKAKEKGAWQVREKYWGKVPATIEEQALQNEKIMDELLNADNDIFEALIRYNAGSNRKAGLKYAKKVRKKALEVSLLEVI